MPGRLYIVDTSAFVEAWKDLYTPGSFQHVWKWIDDHIGAGLLVSHHEVIPETQWPDDLVDWIKDRKAIFTDSEPDEQTLCADLLVNYPDFRPEGGKAQWADPWLVARAKRLGGVVVTQERNAQSQKRIPYVCEQEGIEWVRVEQMVNILGTKYR